MPHHPLEIYWRREWKRKNSFSLCVWQFSQLVLFSAHPARRDREIDHPDYYLGMKVGPYLIITWQMEESVVELDGGVLEEERKNCMVWEDVSCPTCHSFGSSLEGALLSHLLSC